MSDMKHIMIFLFSSSGKADARYRWMIKMTFLIRTRLFQNYMKS